MEAALTDLDAIREILYEGPSTPSELCVATRLSARVIQKNISKLLRGMEIEVFGEIPEGVGVEPEKIYALTGFRKSYSYGREVLKKAPLSRFGTTETSPC